MAFTEIDINTFEGSKPSGTDLVIMERDNESTALVLYGFDEVESELFKQDFKDPVYGFMS